MINFNVRFPDDLHTRVRAQAAADRRSINSEILYLLEVGLATITPTTPARPNGNPAAPTPPHEGSDSSPT
ncbi:Arc family DNA-binding protein [Streptomyces sp. NPDC059452]|uniref:TA system antitoxin ParD family protein n=1 Tax=Streptomyces sp. NPDC059452 TaxID=3346835 RepID=UPI00369A714C